MWHEQNQTSKNNHSIFLQYKVQTQIRWKCSVQGFLPGGGWTIPKSKAPSAPQALLQGGRESEAQDGWRGHWGVAIPFSTWARRSFLSCRSSVQLSAWLLYFARNRVRKYLFFSLLPSFAKLPVMTMLTSSHWVVQSSKLLYTWRQLCEVTGKLIIT